MINSNWELGLQGPLVTIWIQTHTMQIFCQTIAEWSVYTQSATSLIRILERPMGKPKHAALYVSSLFAWHHGEAKKLFALRVGLI